MSACPCGCHQPVKPGNTYATSRCPFRRYAVALGRRGGVRAGQRRRATTAEEWRKRIEPLVRRKLAETTRELYTVREIEVLVTVMLCVVQAEYRRGYGAGHQARRQAQRRKRVA